MSEWGGSSEFYGAVCVADGMLDLPLFQFCKGSCMFLEGDFFKQSCASEFPFNFGVMMAAVWPWTGMVVVCID